MLGLFIASFGLSTAVAGTLFLAPVAQSRRVAVDTAGTLRFWTIFLGLFGLTGAPLTLLELAAPIPAAIAVGVAGVLARCLSPLFRETSADVGLARLVGSEARVLLPVGASAGKVVIQTLADRIELPARSDDGGRIEQGARVLVAFIEDGVAAVISLEARAHGVAATLPPGG